LEQNLKKHWDSLWVNTAKGGFVQSFSSFFSKRATEECWQMYSNLLDMCSFDSAPKILELGAGSGNMTFRILKKINGYATFIDYSEKALSVAKQNAKKEGLLEKASFSNADVFRYIPEEKYDLVHSGGLIEHFPMPRIDELVKKHANFAKASGYVIIMVPTPVWWYKITRKLLESIHWWPPNFETPFNKKMLDQIVKRNGLNVLRSLQSNRLARASAIVGTPQVIE